MKDSKWMPQSIKTKKPSRWSQTHSEPSDGYFLAKIFGCIQPLALFAKHFILGVLQGYEYASDKTKQNPGALSFISQKIRTAISANFFNI